MVADHRYSVLLLCILIALASGSNYAFSAYAPQLGANLHASSTELNMIGVAGNLGVYLSGPLWGRVLDARGPRYPLVAATFLQMLGYIGLRYIFNHAQAYLAQSAEAQEPADNRLSRLGLIFAMACMCATGAGSAAGLMSGISSVARAFPIASRGMASAITIAGYGLSALLFATLLRTACDGRISPFLTVLAIGTSAPMFVGAILLQQDSDNGGHRDEHLYLAVSSNASPIVVAQRQNGTTGTAMQYADLNSTEFQNHNRRLVETSARTDPDQEDEDSGSSLNETGIRNLEDSSAQHRSAPDLSGTQLVRSVDFWLIFALLLILSGTGLLYINNIGAMVSTLNVSNKIVKLDPEDVTKLQAVQVSTISAGNCIGRLCAGIVGDYLHNSHAVSRAWLLVPISLLMTFSQILAYFTEHVEQLSRVSSVLGFAYGSTFSLLPMVTLEWFGIKHFAGNWGAIALAPAAGGNIANILFGWIYDTQSTLRDHSQQRILCTAGRQCYRSVFIMTFGSCLIAALSQAVNYNLNVVHFGPSRRGLDNWRTERRTDVTFAKIQVLGSAQVTSMLSRP